MSNIVKAPNTKTPNTLPATQTGNSLAVSQQNQLANDSISNLPPIFDDLEINIVDVSSGVYNHAYDYADERLRQQTCEKGLKTFFKRVWLNWSHDYLRQKYAREGIEQQVQENNLFVLQNGTADDHNNAMKAIIDRFASPDLRLHQSENDDTQPSAEKVRLQEDIKQIVLQYVQGDIDENQLLENKKSLLKTYKPTTKDKKSGLLYADNILEVAQNAKAAYKISQGIKAIDQALNVKLNKAQVGVRTEVVQTATDRLIDKINKRKIGLLANETAVGATVAIGLALGKITVQKAVTAVLSTVTLGVATGGIAGIRENYHIKQERQMHLRQMAEGSVIDSSNNKRRSAIEATRYDSKKAEALSSALTSAITECRQTPNDQNIEKLILVMEEAKTRETLSVNQKIDLISYKNKFTVEEERLELARLVAQAKASLIKMSEASDNTFDAKKISDQSKKVSEDINNTLNQDVDNKEASFKKLKLKKVLGAIAVAGTFGVILGGITQELRADTINPGMKGLLNKFTPHQNRQTELNYFLDKQKHFKNVYSHFKNNKIFSQGSGSINIPNGYHIVKSKNPNFNNLVNSKGKIIARHIGFTSSGLLNKDTITQLKNHGFKFNTLTEQTNTIHPTITTQNLNPTQYIQAHKSQFTSVNRQLWYTQNNPQINQNELKLDWGGNYGSGIDSSGNYVMNVSHMLSNGSYVGNNSTNVWQLIHSGQLKLAVSLTKGTENKVIFVPVSANGTAIFNKNNPLFSSLFTNVNGQAQFKGAYIEAAQLMGKNAHNAENVRMLATVVGNNQLTTITQQVSIPSVGHITELIPPKLLKLSSLGSFLPIEITPAIPFRARLGLEGLVTPINQLPDSSSLSPVPPSTTPQIALTSSVPPSVTSASKPNFTPNLNAAKEITNYNQHLAQSESTYFDNIKKTVENIPNLKNLSSNTKAIVILPVNIIEDAEKVYETLSLYNQQDQEAKSQTLILLNAYTFPQEELASDEINKRSLLAKKNIHQAIHDFPELDIAYIENKLGQQDEKVNKIDQLYATTATKTLYDMALFAIDNANQTKQKDPQQDVLLIRNSIDTQGMKRHYLKNMINHFEKYSTADGFRGLNYHQTRSHVDYPGFGLVTKFEEIMNIIGGSNTIKSTVKTPETNFAIKSSTLAQINSLNMGSEEELSKQTDTDILVSKIYHLRSSKESINKSNKFPAPIKIVPGATLDIESARQLLAYRLGKSITSQEVDVKDFNKKFDENVLFQKENLVTKFPEVVRRINDQITAVAQEWSTDEKRIRVGLKMLFPLTTHDQKIIYKFGWNQGKVKFEFTPDGEKWLYNKMVHGTSNPSRNLDNPQGDKLDLYGLATKRRLYNLTSQHSKRQIVTQISRLVLPTMQK